MSFAFADLARTGRRLLVALLAIAAPTGGTSAQQQQMPPPAVVVSPATMTEVSETAILTGRAVASQKVDIQPRVTGFIESRDFKEGTRVNAGDILFRIEDSLYRAAVNQIDGALVAARAAESLARIERDRQAQLVERQTVARAALDTAEAKLSEAHGQVMSLEAQLDTARINLSYTGIKAPFTGVVGLASADVGALVSPQTGTLATIILDDPMTVEFPVSDADRLRFKARVASGEASPLGAVGLTLADGSVYDRLGDIDYSSADVSRSTDTVLVRAVFPNPDGRILDGSLVRVSLKINSPKPALTVPQQAVQRDMQGAFVLVVGEGSKVEIRRVDVVSNSSGRSVIGAGLKKGEQVIVEGVNKARPGAVVNAAPEAAG